MGLARQPSENDQTGRYGLGNGVLGCPPGRIGTHGVSDDATRHNKWLPTDSGGRWPLSGTKFLQTPTKIFPNPPNPVEIHQNPSNAPKPTQIIIFNKNHNFLVFALPKRVCSTRGYPPPVLNIIIVLTNYVPRRKYIFCDRFDKIQSGGTRRGAIG